VNGKGGTGKTTIAALLVAHLAANKKGSVLAIDADPNSCLADALGVAKPQTIVGVCEEISKQKDRIPAGMTKDRFIEMRVQESLAEEKGFDLLVMGRPEGPGCYCYVNNLLRDIIGRVAKAYDYVVIDNAAGMEHISRRTAGVVNSLLLVSDYSVNGVRSTKRIYDLAKEMKIKMGGAWLVVNRVDGLLSELDDEIGKTSLAFAGEVPYSDKLAKWSLSNRPIFELNDTGIKRRICEIFERLMENKDAVGACKGKI
jgi:CO dehydrogenase maturation factor